MADNLEFSLLGPVRASYRNRQLDLGPARERAILCVLLCRANEVMSGEALLDAVWDDKPPHSGTKVIPTYVYRLRKAIAPAGNAVTIESLRDGYTLRTGPDNLDITRFADALTLAREPHGDPGELRTTLLDALALWRGTPFTGLTGPLIDAERRRLEEQRLCLREELAELDLRLGRPAEVAEELRPLYEENPWRERIAALLMFGLYRSGRQVDALSVYNDTRAALRDSLGLDPGAELSAAYQAVLRNDDPPAALGLPPATPSATAPEAAPPVRRDLPAAPGTLVGRDTEVRRLTSAATQAAPVLVVDGMAGVGKTALGLAVAHELVQRHPDGQLYLDLRGGAGEAELDAAEALRRLLVAVREPEIPGTVAERSSSWRAGLADRRVLVVLDNVAHSDQVLPLLPGADGCTVLVIGRRRLYGLPATASVTLGPLPADGARELFGHLAGERSPADRADAVRTLLHACAGLPLALVRAADAVRHRGGSVLHEFAGLVAADPLRALRAEDDSLAVVFEPCLAGCSPVARTAFRQLRETPRPVAEVAAALGWHPAATGDALHELLDASLATRAEAGWYTHPLLVACAGSPTSEPAVRPVPSAPAAGRPAA